MSDNCLTQLFDLKCFVGEFKCRHKTTNREYSIYPINRSNNDSAVNLQLIIYWWDKELEESMHVELLPTQYDDYELIDFDLKSMSGVGCDSNKCNGEGKHIYHNVILCNECYEIQNDNLIIEGTSVYKFHSLKQQRGVLKLIGANPRDAKVDVEKGLIFYSVDYDYDYVHTTIIDAKYLGDLL